MGTWSKSLAKRSVHLKVQVCHGECERSHKFYENSGSRLPAAGGMKS
jgi:hypothetical protein